MLKSESKRKMTSKVGHIAASETHLVNSIFQQLCPACLPLGQLLATQAAPLPQGLPSTIPGEEAASPTLQMTNEAPGYHRLRGHPGRGWRTGPWPRWWGLQLC